MNFFLRHVTAIQTAFAFFVAVLLSGCGSGCGTLGVANTSPCDSTAASTASTTATTSTFSIFGTVSGTAPQSVTISLTGAESLSTTTGASGSYTFTALPTGSYTVVPSVQGSTFNPASTAITVSGANVTVNNFVETINTLGTFGISGTVTGAVVQNVLITLSGANIGSALTDPSGGYSFSGLAAGTGTITVTPSLAGHTFSPASNTVTTTSVGTAATINFTEAAAP